MHRSLALQIMCATALAPTACDVSTDAVPDASDGLADASLDGRGGPDVQRHVATQTPRSASAPVAAHLTPSAATRRPFARPDAARAVLVDAATDLLRGAARRGAEATASVDAAVDATARALRGGVLDREVGAWLGAAPLRHESWAALVDEGAVVLSAEIAPTWLGGPARYTSVAGDVYTMARSVDAAALPPWLNALTRRPVTLYDARGATCRATLGAPRLRSRFRHASYHGLPDATPPPRARVGQAADDERWAQGAQVLVAPLVDARGRGCADALYAAPSGGPARAFSEEGAPAPALAKAALEAFRATPAWREIQAWYTADIVHGGLEDAGLPATWDTLYGQPPTIRVFRAATDGPAVVTVARAAGGGCAEPGGRLSAAFTETAEGDLTPIFVDALGRAPAAVADLTGDRGPEFIFHADDGGIEASRVTAGELAPLHAVALPDYSPWVCPC